MLKQRLILILEQNAVDASFLERCFLEERVCNPCRVLRTRDRLRCYLEGIGSYQNREVFPLPSLLLLDLHYSNSGLELLQWLRNSGFLDKFPIIGIGASLLDSVVQRAFDLGLNGFFEKPSDLRELTKMICHLQWVDELTPSIPSNAGIRLVTKAEYSFRQTE